MKKVLSFLISALFVLAAFTGCNQDYKNTGSFCMVMPSASITVPDYANPTDGDDIVIDKVLYKVKITPCTEDIEVDQNDNKITYFSSDSENVFYRYAESGETLVIDNLEPGYYEFNFFAFADYGDGFYWSSQFDGIEYPLFENNLNKYPNFLKIEANKVCSLDVTMTSTTLSDTPNFSIGSYLSENKSLTCSLGYLMNIKKLTAKIYINDKLYATKSFENPTGEQGLDFTLPYKSSIIKEGENKYYAIIDYDDCIYKTYISEFVIN